jgi:L-2-hydroxyglutarate oxidase
VINAAGLYADELAEELGEDIRVIPFRGYYAELRPDRTYMVNSHVYAAPNLTFPFLGIHLSKRTDGRVIAGPGAMLAFGREAYSFGSLSGGRLGKTLGWPGFYRMLKRPEFQNLMKQEIKKSLMVRAIGREAMQLIPELTEKDFVRSYAGNRAQLVDRNGELVDDIVVRDTPRTVHVLNAVSPGLTCSLPFGKFLAEQAIAKL